MNKPTLKESFLKKMTLAASRGCELISIRRKFMNRDGKVWYESIGEIPLQTSSDAALTVNIYKAQYEEIMKHGDATIVDENIVRRTGKLGAHVYQITIVHEIVTDTDTTANLKRDIGHPTDKLVLQSQLIDKINEYSKDEGCAGIYVRSALTMRLLGSFPRIEETDPADYIADVIAKANIFLQEYGDCQIQTEYPRKRPEPNGTISTFYEIYINDYDFGMMGKEPKDLCTYDSKKCQVMYILLKSMNKLTSFDLCKSLSLIMKDENGELIDCAELKF